MSNQNPVVIRTCEDVFDHLEGIIVNNPQTTWQAVIEAITVTKSKVEGVKCAYCNYPLTDVYDIPLKPIEIWMASGATPGQIAELVKKQGGWRLNQKHGLRVGILAKTIRGFRTLWRR